MQWNCTSKLTVLNSGRTGEVHLVWVSQENSWVMPSHVWLCMSRWPRAKLCSFLCSHNVIPVSVLWPVTCCGSSLCEGPPPSLRQAVGHPKDSLKWALFFTNLTLAQHFFVVLVDSYICSFPQRHFLSEEARRQWRNGVTHDSWSLPQIPHVFFLCCTVYSYSSFS